MLFCLRGQDPVFCEALTSPLPPQRGPEMTISDHFWPANYTFCRAGPEMSKISQLSCKWCNFWSAQSGTARAGCGRRGRGMRPLARTRPPRPGPGAAAAARRTPVRRSPFSSPSRIPFQRACAGYPPPLRSNRPLAEIRDGNKNKIRESVAGAAEMSEGPVSYFRERPVGIPQ